MPLIWKLVMMIHIGNLLISSNSSVNNIMEAMCHTHDKLRQWRESFLRCFNYFKTWANFTPMLHYESCADQTGLKHHSSYKCCMYAMVLGKLGAKGRRSGVFSRALSTSIPDKLGHCGRYLPLQRQRQRRESKGRTCPCHCDEPTRARSPHS